MSRKISVVIPCFNHGEFLPEAVASVVNLRRDDVEVLVVDDGSADERTREVMDALQRQGIKPILQENKGLAAARNAGVRASHGEYIFPLDADDRLRDAWIDRGIQILDSEPSVGVVCGDADLFGSITLRWPGGPFDLERLMQQNYICASALYRRLIWEQNSGYDATMPVQGYEDWDFWLGAVEHGWKFAYLPEVFFEYRKASESMLTRAQPFEEEVAAFIARKHGVLYRQAWLSGLGERRSAKRTARRLVRLLMSRAKAKLNRDGKAG